MNTILQIPMKKDLREQAQLAAEKMGFSSLQEPVRIFLTQLASGNTMVKFEQHSASGVLLQSKKEAEEGKATELKGSLIDLWHEAQQSTDN